jgi:hypothetical protein
MARTGRFYLASALPQRLKPEPLATLCGSVEALCFPGEIKVEGRREAPAPHDQLQGQILTPQKAREIPRLSKSRFLTGLGARFGMTSLLERNSFSG